MSSAFKTLSLLVLPLLLTAGMAEAAIIRVAFIAQVTNDGDRDAETSIAINPLDSRNLVAGWIDGGSRSCGFGVSFDGGRSWRTGVLPGVVKGFGGRFDRGTDPSVVFDQTGNAYYTCLAFDLFPPGTTSAGAILVSKSTDRELTWGAPVVAIAGLQVNEFQDHQFITTNPATGALYIAETEFTAFGKPEILFLQSVDGGRTWSEPIRINDFAGNAFFQDSFTATGRDPNTIYLTFGAFSNAGLSNWDRIFISKSTDGGLSFTRQQLLKDVVPLPDPLPNAPWRSDNNLWVAVDRPTNHIYVNFADYRNGDADIWVLRVRDDPTGFVVEGETRVNDDPVSNGADQFFPFITVAPSGRVDVCFQDRRYAPGNSLIFTTCAFSTDGGQTFRNIQVTQRGFDASNNNFIGDYNWQASLTDAVLPVFVGDGVAGGGSAAQEVFVARVRFDP